MDYFKGLQNSGKVPEKDLKTYVLSAVQVTHKTGQRILQVVACFCSPLSFHGCSIGFESLEFGGTS